MALISSNGLPPACTMCIDFSILFYYFIFHFLFLSYTRYSFIHSILLILLVLAIITKWLTWRVTRMSNFEEPATMSKWVDDSDDGKKTRGKACESGWYPCDGRRKFSTVGHLGGVTRDLSCNSRKFRNSNFRAVRAIRVNRPDSHLSDTVELNKF
jgi:hypothetical protein